MHGVVPSTVGHSVWSVLVRLRGACPKLYALNYSSFKGKKHSSQQWLARQSRDPYVKKAVGENWRCRSAFKLIEIDDKYKILRPGYAVVDCGASPGSWCQVAVNRVNTKSGDDKLPKRGKVIGIDLLQMAPLPGAILLSQSDFTCSKTQRKVLDILNGKKVDVVLSDMAPNATGHRATDHELIIQLCASAFKFSQVVLRPGGSFLCKLWQGSEQKRLEDAMKIIFKHVNIVKPASSRSDSAEIFMLGRVYKPPKTNDVH